MSIFEKRIAFKPYEYPKALEFVEVLQASIWNHKEFNFTQDIQDFMVNLSEKEKEIVRRCLLAISQIEINVKTFWSKLYDHLPKPEFNSLGTMLAYNELVHEQSYSELLEILGLNGDFEKVLQVPEIQGRVDYLQKYIKGSADNVREAYTLNIALFSSFVENCSLFSQFFIMKSLNQHKNYFKGVDNVISATMLEEDIHAKVGAWLISLIKTEHPEWFDEEFEKKIIRACKKAYDAELKIVDWITSGEDMDILKRSTIDHFLRNRFNKSLQMIGIEPVFEVDEQEIQNFEWFELELKLDRHTDFFNQRPTTYSRDIEDVTEDSLF